MEIQERIVTKAHELFMRFGIRSISMDEIASNLGISKKTIYHSFKDKDALVDGVLEIEMNRMECDCSKTKEVCENAVHEIFLALEIMEELFAGFNPSILFDLEKYHPESYKRFTDHHNSYLYETISENLVRGIKEGLYRVEINIDIISKFRIGSMFLIFNMNYFPHGSYSLPQLGAEITDNFLHGLVTEKGREQISKYKIERQKNKL